MAVVELLWRLQANVSYPVNIVPDPLPITVLFRTSIVPAILRGDTFREPRSALITEQIPILTVIPMEIQFEFRTERSLAIPASIWHVYLYPVLS